ncbi:MAG: hypothetical protein ACI3Y8_01290, partial [Candidatus Cryptobacteroides sp.]
QKNASLLILPLRKEPEYRATLPGKLFEYLASMVPILGIGQTDGAMARIINETRSGVVFDWDDEESVRTYIAHCWRSFSDENENPARPDNADIIARFSRRNLTGRMACLFQRVCR